jgi:hypothetical protein
MKLAMMSPFGAPAIAAALTAPIDTPATAAGCQPSSTSLATTPYSNAPSAPPPCKINAIFFMNAPGCLGGKKK